MLCLDVDFSACVINELGCQENCQNPYIRDRGVSSKSRIYILSDLQTKFSIHMMVCRAKYNSQEQ